MGDFGRTIHQLCFMGLVNDHEEFCYFFDVGRGGLEHEAFETLSNGQYEARVIRSTLTKEVELEDRTTGAVFKNAVAWTKAITGNHRFDRKCLYVCRGLFYINYNNLVSGNHDAWTRDPISEIIGSPTKPTSQGLMESAPSGFITSGGELCFMYDLDSPSMNPESTFEFDTMDTTCHETGLESFFMENQHRDMQAYTEHEMFLPVESTHHGPEMHLQMEQIQDNYTDLEAFQVYTTHHELQGNGPQIETPSPRETTHHEISPQMKTPSPIQTTHHEISPQMKTPSPIQTTHHELQENYSKELASNMLHLQISYAQAEQESERLLCLLRRLKNIKNRVPTQDFEKVRGRWLSQTITSEDETWIRKNESA